VLHDVFLRLASESNAFSAARQDMSAIVLDIAAGLATLALVATVIIGRVSANSWRNPDG